MSCLEPRAGVLNLLLLMYRQIKIELLLRTPKKTFEPLLWAYYDMILISVYPLPTLCVPLGVRVPQVVNCWPRIIMLSIAE
jgi:hypothetical protein